MLVAIVALLMIFGIPLSAIIGGYYVKLKRMEIEAGGGGNAGVLAHRVAQLEADNRDARARIEVLETIVTADEPAASARVRVDAASVRAKRPAPGEGLPAATSSTAPAAMRSKD